MGPADERRSVWRVLAGTDHWAVILIRHEKKGSPPEKPRRNSAPRMSPEWLRQTGAGLTPEELLHERIGQHLRAHAQDDAEVDVARAASIATDAAMAALAELGVSLPASEGSDR